MLHYLWDVRGRALTFPGVGALVHAEGGPDDKRTTLPNRPRRPRGNGL